MNLLPIEKQYIQEVVNRIQDDGGTIMMITAFGSHLYGTNTPESDSDFMIVYLPDLRKAAAGAKAKSYRAGTNLSNTKNTSGDIDVQGVDIREVIKKFTKGEIVAIDLMFAHTNKKTLIYLHDRFNEFLRKYIYNSGVIRPYGVAGVVGYINQQAQKYGIKGTRLGQVIRLRDFVAAKFDRDWKVAEVIEALQHQPKILDGEYIKLTTVAVTKPGGVIEDDIALDILGKKALPTSTVGQLLDMLNKHIDKYGHRARQAMNNEGIDWKAISHAFRAIHEYNQLVRTGMVTFPFSHELSDKLIELKKGMRDFNEVQDELSKALESVKSVSLGERVPNEDIARAIFFLWIGDVSDSEVDEFLATAPKEEILEAEKVGLKSYVQNRKCSLPQSRVVI